MSRLIFEDGPAAYEVVAESTRALAERLSYLRSVIGPVGYATPDDDRVLSSPAHPVWLDCRELVSDEKSLAEIVQRCGQVLGTDDQMVTASLFVQGYAYRLFAFAVGCLTLRGVILDERPSSLAIGIAKGRPSVVAFTTPRAMVLSEIHSVEDTLGDPAIVDDCLRCVISQLIDDHLRLLIETLRSTIRVGERLLWGNVVASAATAFRTMEGLLGPWVKALGLRFLELVPLELQGQGSFLSLQHDDREGWFWERTNCCLYDRISPDIRCADCSRTPVEERRRNYLASLAR